jgi:hypothetical protein
MKTKLLLLSSAALLALGMGSANAAPMQLSASQMDKVSAGGGHGTTIYNIVLIFGGHNTLNFQPVFVSLPKKHDSRRN